MGWFRSDRVTWRERGVWVALVGAAIAPVALMPHPENVALAYVEAINRGDVEAALALTGDRYQVNPELERRFLRGPDARGILEWRAALHERWRTRSWAYDPVQREVQTMVEITNDAWDLVGVRPLVEVVLVVRASEMVLDQARIDSKDLRPALEPFLAWARAERPEALDAVWRDRSPRWSAAAAGGLLELLREWRASGAGVAEKLPPGQG